MYEMAKKAREAMKSKARRLAGEKDIKTDSSTWSPAPLLRSNIKTGARPIMKPSAKGIGESNAARDTKAAIGDAKRGAFKSGGAVKDAGVKDKKALGAIDPSPKRGAAQNYKKGGRIKKLSGGTLSDYIKGASSELRSMAEQGPIIEPADVLKMNKRDHYSGVAADKLLKKIKGKSGTAEKRGGRIKREDGGQLPSPYEAMRSEERMGRVKVEEKNKMPSPKEAAESAARVGDVPEGRKSGGKKWLAKVMKKTAKKRGGGVGLTVVIADKGGRAAPQGMTAPIAPRAVPVPQAAAPMPMPAAPPPAQMPPVPMRKSGGRITKVASSYKDMQAGAANGEGRLQKTDIAKKRKGAPTA